METPCDCELIVTWLKDLYVPYDSHVTNNVLCIYTAFEVYMYLTPLGPVVTLNPINAVVNEGAGSVTFDISATRNVSIVIQTVSGSAGTNYTCSHTNHCRGVPT